MQTHHLTGTLLAGVITLLVAHQSASAQTLANDSFVTNVNSVVVGDSNGTEGYYLPATLGTPSNQIVNPGYVASVSQTAFGFGGSSTLTVGDGTDPTQTVTTGGYFRNPPASGLAYFDIIDFTFNAANAATPTPSSFVLGLLTDNAGFPNTYYQIGLYDSSNNQIGSTLQVNTTVSASENKNDFYYVTIAGAAGDHIDIFGESSTGSYANLGGVTFLSELATPEPATYGLMFVGLGMLIVVTRLRRRNA